MELDWQHILAYLTLLIACAYLVHKYLWPVSGKKRKKSAAGDCGSGDCGCH